jgi:predicted DCC family thiol-disulfide oxidoreductase YuxK
MRRLYILYDFRCGICARLRVWMQQQRAYVPVEFIAAGSNLARRMFPTLLNDGEPRELVAVTDEGDVYLDDAAWLVSLWTLVEYRTWSYRFARGPLRPLARTAWDFLSTNRQQLAQMLSLKSDEEVARELDRRSTGACDLT